MTHYSRISCADAQSLIASKDVHIIDIRDLDSFNSGHMLDAEHIDNTSLANYIDETDQEVPLIVCCYHGNSSQSAAAYMVEKGFAEVYSLDGGFTQWSSDYPDACEKEI